MTLSWARDQSCWRKIYCFDESYVTMNNKYDFYYRSCIICNLVERRNQPPTSSLVARGDVGDIWASKTARMSSLLLMAYLLQVLFAPGWKLFCCVDFIGVKTPTCDVSDIIAGVIRTCVIAFGRRRQHLPLCHKTIIPGFSDFEFCWTIEKLT